MSIVLQISRLNQVLKLSVTGMGENRKKVPIIIRYTEVVAVAIYLLADHVRNHGLYSRKVILCLIKPFAVRDQTLQAE